MCGNAEWVVKERVSAGRRLAAAPGVMAGLTRLDILLVTFCGRRLWQIDRNLQSFLPATPLVSGGAWMACGYGWLRLEKPSPRSVARRRSHGREPVEWGTSQAPDAPRQFLFHADCLADQSTQSTSIRLLTLLELGFVSRPGLRNKPNRRRMCQGFLGQCASGRRRTPRPAFCRLHVPVSVVNIDERNEETANAVVDVSDRSWDVSPKDIGVPPRTHVADCRFLHRA